MKPQFFLLTLPVSKPIEINRERWRLARERIAAALREDPVLSNRSVARATGTHHLTVASEREVLELIGEIPEIHKRRGSDGRVWGHRK